VTQPKDQHRPHGLAGGDGLYTGGDQGGHPSFTCEMSHVFRFQRSNRHPTLAFIATFTILLATLSPAAGAPGPSGEPAPSTSIASPDVTAQSVFSFDLASGITLYEKNPDERMQIGSTVKVVTALVVMQRGDPADEVLIDESDTVDITVYSNMQLQAGDTLTVGTLLYGLLIPSGSDGALALARHVGLDLCECDNIDDARNAFYQAMNDYAAELGLENSRFTNASGIDAENAYSSARDIALLFGELSKNERLAGIVAEPAYSFDSIGTTPRNYQSQTTNQLLGQLGVIGGKTGSTEAAGGCVVLARQVNDGSNTVISAVLGADLEYQDSVIVEGSDERWNDARAIFSGMDEQFTWVTPGAEGTFPGLAEEMAVWQVQFNDPPTIPYPASGVTPAYQLVLRNAPEADAEGGAVRLYYDQEQVGSVPVYYTTAQSASTADEPGR
ncbi:MAG: serine hydrolase, partial [Thermomicrobiales bacterium]